MKVNDPRCNSCACASGRANSSAAAAIVIDVASGRTVRNSTYNKQKPGAAAADRATYSR